MRRRGKREDEGEIREKKGENVEFLLQNFKIRPDDRSLLLRSGRLLQQYVVDNYVKVEAEG
ncbi:hypothetical protein Lal_00026753 [Lupinus albus]|nr:hypothetical protein Lal_00026753 [Lupinus albus]